MSNKTNNTADSQDGVEKIISNDDATIIAQKSSLELLKVEESLSSNIIQCTETSTSEVPDLPCTQNIISHDNNSHTLSIHPSIHDNEAELHGEKIEEASSRDAIFVSSSSQNQMSICETEKNEGSDDGSDYKDAEVSKEDRHNLSDSEQSLVGSESSTEEIHIGRRNRRPSNELLKDNFSEDESVGKGVTDSENEPQGTRESGDGEEKSKDKVLDRDEDKKDPQYIPKKGVFYEHDDRTFDDGPAAPPEEEPNESKKKKVVADNIDKWGHDMFDTSKQSPKTTQDLIDYYGYDIRNEEEPPKAWRSRRYGRGPNKYTRQWQDEAAYRNKRQPVSKPPTPFKNNIEDFPTVEQSKSGYRRNRTNNLNNDQSSGSRGNLNRGQSPRERSDTNRKKAQVDASLGNSSSNSQSKHHDRVTSGRDHRFKDIQVEKTVFLNKKKPFSSVKTKSEAEAEADIAALSKEFSNAVINIGRDGKILPIGANTPNGSNQKADQIETKEIQVEPAVTASTGGAEGRMKERRGEVGQAGVGSSKSKRYSSQRQRSLPQSNHLQQQQAPQQQQQFIHQQQFFPPPPPTAPDPDPALFSGFQSNPPPPVYTDSMQGVVFLPGYPPTPPPHLLNYCPAPQQYGMPPPPPLGPPPLGPPPPDMFPAQPPQGITYYSPQSQVQPRPPASRRVKVAIPIVAPPDQGAHSDPPCS